MKTIKVSKVNMEQIKKLQALGYLVIISG